MEKTELKRIFVSGNMPAKAEYKSALHDVLRTFPYFQLAQVLFAKQLYDTHEPESSIRIKLASVYAPDRKAMYLLFKKPTDKTGEVKSENKPVGGNEKNEVTYNFVYSSTTTENKDEIVVSPKKESNVITSLSEAFIKKELVTSLPINKPPVQPSAENQIKSLPKQHDKENVVQEKKQYTPPTIEKKRSFYEKKKEDAIQKIAITPRVDKIDPVIEAKKEEGKYSTSKGISTEESAAIEPKIFLPEIISPPNVSEPITENKLRYSFNSWLKVIPEISIEKKEETKSVSPKKTLTIIDDFLKKEPTISRPKTEFFSPVKAAKMSITENDEIISETLAKIYVTQGNLPKALKAYQTLLIQFPEKKNIFAARIEEIKALIRENTKPGTK